MQTRREFLAGGLLALVHVSGTPCCAQELRRRARGPGCVLTERQAQPFLYTAGQRQLFISGKEPMIAKSGNKDFDMALAQTLAKIASAFEVLPHFAYYDDYDGQNAYATNAVRSKRSDGTVLFGQGLLQELMANIESPAVAVAAVCAHEFGHILQYKRGLDRVLLDKQPTVKRVELQADFFAGYFAGKRKLERPSYPAAVVAITQFGYGDNDVDSESHHGTPKQRGDAVVAGFNAAYRSQLSLADAIESSVAYVAAQ